MFRMFWNGYTFEDIPEKKIVYIFTWDKLNVILISRIIQTIIWFNMEKQELCS